MTSPLAGSLARTIGKAMSGIFLDATYTMAATGTGSPYDPDDGVPASYPCKAIFDQWGAYYQANSLVAEGDRKVLILASTLPVQPSEGDQVMIDGVVLTVVSNGEGAPAVSTDPAKAVWTLRCRT